MNTGKLNENVLNNLITVLLVDDEEMLRKLNSEILRTSGYKVFEAGNGVEALAIVENEKLEIDLLMTDMMMPLMGGQELAEKLLITHPEMSVLFTSGYNKDMVTKEGKDINMDNFLQKPFTMDALLGKIEEVLKK